MSYICINKTTRNHENNNRNTNQCESKKTFTIRTEGSKYRTIPMSQEEFESCENNTANDWQHFLSNTDDYYVVK